MSVTFRQIYSRLVDDILKDRPFSNRLIKDERVNFADRYCVQLINEGEARLAELTHYLIDQTTASVSEIALQDGVSEYPLHSSVISLYGPPVILEAGTKKPKQRLARFPEQRALVSLDISSGAPCRFRLGRRNIQVWPTPGPDEVGQVIKFSCYRKPLVPYTVPASNSDAAWDVECEFPDEYAYTSLHYVVSTALKVSQDLDAVERQAAEAATAMWQREYTALKDEALLATMNTSPSYFTNDIMRF